MQAEARWTHSEMNQVNRTEQAGSKPKTSCKRTELEQNEYTSTKLEPNADSCTESVQETSAAPALQSPSRKGGSEKGDTGNRSLSSDSQK